MLYALCRYAQSYAFISVIELRGFPLIIPKMETVNYHIHITQTAERDMIRAANYIEFTLKNTEAADRLHYSEDMLLQSARIFSCSFIIPYINLLLSALPFSTSSSSFSFSKFLKFLLFCFPRQGKMAAKLIPCGFVYAFSYDDLPSKILQKFFS